MAPSFCTTHIPPYVTTVTSPPQAGDPRLTDRDEVVRAADLAAPAAEPLVHQEDDRILAPQGGLEDALGVGGVDGMTTTSPGVCMNQASRLLLCCAA